MKHITHPDIKGAGFGQLLIATATLAGLVLLAACATQPLPPPAPDLHGPMVAAAAAPELGQAHAQLAEMTGTGSDAARNEAAVARSAANMARDAAASSHMDADVAQRQAADLKGQITALNAQVTARGLVVTLGDALFASGRDELRDGATRHLAQLANFLNRYYGRSVIVEGHTDSVGNSSANTALSLRRAETIKAYLIGQGVSASRISASGLGEASPAAGNDSATGRQQNRRVEVVISNTVASAR